MLKNKYLLTGWRNMNKLVIKTIKKELCWICKSIWKEVISVLCDPSNPWTLIHFFSLVFSQSLISLDLIEDFLELASREKTEDKDKPLIYKGELQTFLYHNFWNLHLNILYKHFNNKGKNTPQTYNFNISIFLHILLVLIYINMVFIVVVVTWNKIFCSYKELYWNNSHIMQFIHFKWKIQWFLVFS